MNSPNIGGPDTASLPHFSEPNVTLTWSSYGSDGDVARVEVDRTDKLNVVGTRQIDGLARVIRKIAEVPSLRAIVLTGAGDRAFIGGADIADMAVLDAESAGPFIMGLHQLCEAIRSAPCPVIARIDGYCLGGGLEVAAACDMRAASDRSKFGMPEVNVGIPSVIDGALLPRLIGLGKASELVLTGRTIDSSEALRYGLVEQVTVPEKLDDMVALWLRHILAADQAAIARQKDIIRDWVSVSYDDAVRRSVVHYVDSFKGTGPSDRMNAFLNRKR